MIFSWADLAAADRLAVEEHIETDEIIAHKIETQCEEVDERAIESLKKQLDVIYREAKDNCSFDRVVPPFALDQQMGHTSLGVFTKEKLFSSDIVKGVVGLLASMPSRCINRGKNDFSVHSTTAGQILMLGPVSFVNSSCRPNCEYQLDKKNMVMRLRVKTGLEIGLGEELNVQYSGSYFGENRDTCACPFIEYHSLPCAFRGRTRSQTQKFRDTEETPYVFLENFLTEHVEQESVWKTKEVSNVTKAMVDEPNGSCVNSVSVVGAFPVTTPDNHDENVPPVVSPIPSQTPNTSRSCAKNHETSGLDWYPFVSTPLQKRFRSSRIGKIFVYKNLAPKTNRFDPLTFNEESNESVEEELGNCSFILGTQPSISSGQKDYLDEILSCEDYATREFIRENDNRDSELNGDFDLSETFLDYLSPHVRYSENNLKLALSLLSCYNCLTDKCRNQLWVFVKILLPYDTVLTEPTLNVVNCSRFYNRFILSHDEYFSLDIEYQLRSVFDKTFEVIMAYKSRSCDNLEDFRSRNHTSNLFPLIMNTDGVPLPHGSNSVWPVWLSIIDLPPILRFSFKNMILAGLWFGRGKPDWDFIIPLLAGDLSNLKNHGILVRNRMIYFKIDVLICDMAAKPPLLNMTTFNGYFGCPYCLVKGEFHRPVVYPTSSEIILRTENGFKCDGLTAESNRAPVNGVYRTTKLGLLLQDIPHSLPFDPLHQAFGGVTKFLLENISKVLGFKLRSVINELLRDVKYPHEVTRTNVNFDDYHKWKATQYRIFLFHIGPILLRRVTNDLTMKDNKRLINVVLNFCLFSFGIRILSSRSVTPADIKLAKTMLDTFNNSFLSCYDVRQQRFNVHAIRHFPYQVEKFGPLWATSSFAFESANHHLVRTTMSTVNQAKLIVERFVRLKVLLNETVDDDDLKPFMEAFFSNNKRIEATSLTNVPTGIVRLAESKISGAAIENWMGRLKHRGNVYLSRSYTRLPKNASVYLAFSEDVECFGAAEVFFATNAKIYVLVKRLKRNETVRFKNLLLDSWRSQFFASLQKTDFTFDVVDISQIICQCYVIVESVLQETN